jgi:hypothetical protein
MDEVSLKGGHREWNYKETAEKEKCSNEAPFQSATCAGINDSHAVSSHDREFDEELPTLQVPGSGTQTTKTSGQQMPPEAWQTKAPQTGRLVVRVPHGIAEVIQRLKTDGLSKLGTRVAGPKQSVKKAQHSTGDASPELDRHEGKVEVERWWDNLDATKNRGYPAREEGRYGSYPSHDGFDDESEP